MSAGRFEHVSQAQYERDSAGFLEKMPIADIPLPVRATRGSAGYDLICPVSIEIQPGERVTVPTGIRAAIAEGFFLMICPRSSMGRKYGLRLSNTMGIIDSDYYEADNEGHILLVLEHGQKEPVRISAGERVCQAIFIPFGTADGDGAEAQRQGGYGSTGK